MRSLTILFVFSMDIIVEGNTLVGLGSAILKDPFQAGREAAQMAKHQLPSGPSNLVMAMGPGHIGFQDFIEGVRLVLGEESLVGIPFSRILTKDLNTPDTGAVLILQSSSQRFSISSTNIDSKKYLSSATALLSEFREKRGNTKHQFSTHGLINIDNLKTEDRNWGQTISCEIGQDSWIVGISPARIAQMHMANHDSILNQGVIGIECMSNAPWGVGFVELGSFEKTAKILKDAIKTALRDGIQQLENHAAAFAFILFDFPLQSLTQSEIQSLLMMEDPTLRNIPLMGLPQLYPFLKHPSRGLVFPRQCVISLVVPK